jgi:peroxiredoxin
MNQANRRLVYSSLAVLLALALNVSPAPLFAGKYNPNVSIGDKVAEWTDLPGADEKTYSSKDFADRDCLVVVFTCNSCPYAVDYEDRINRLAKKYAAPDAPVAVVAINVNRLEADRLPAMRKRAEERKFVFPYLYDESQQIAKQFGAVRTPEFFVLNKERRIVYMGAMDDNTKESEVQQRYVEQAIEATLHSEPVVVAETPPVGCQVRYVRERSK